MIIGRVDVINKPPNVKEYLKDFGFKYGGHSCRTDQNGIFYLKGDHELQDPLYLLISKGTYFIEKKVCLGNQEISQKELKIEPTASFKFYEIKIYDGKITFEESQNFIKDNFHSIPYEKTIILTLNPEQVLPMQAFASEKFMANNYTLSLPCIKIRGKEEKNLADKSLLRKIKHWLNFNEANICQTQKPSTICRALINAPRLNGGFITAKSRPNVLVNYII